jgi:hypothetical protein
MNIEPESNQCLAGIPVPGLPDVAIGSRQGDCVNGSSGPKRHHNLHNNQVD